MLALAVWPFKHATVSIHIKAPLSLKPLRAVNANSMQQDFSTCQSYSRQTEKVGGDKICRVYRLEISNCLKCRYNLPTANIYIGDLEPTEMLLQSLFGLRPCWAPSESCGFPPGNMFTVLSELSLIPLCSVIQSGWVNFRSTGSSSLPKIPVLPITRQLLADILREIHVEKSSHPNCIGKWTCS